VARVTVHLNTRDRVTYACQMLASLQAQDYTDWDLLIFDGSREPMLRHEEFERLIEAISHNHRVGIHRDKGMGIPQTYQLMLEMSDSELCFREEDDIVFAPGCLRLLVEEFDRDGNERLGAVAPSTPDWRYSTVRALPAPGRFRNGFYRARVDDVPGFSEIWVADDDQRAIYECGPNVTYEVCTLHAGALYRREAMLSIGGFSHWFTPIGHREETHAWCRLYLAGWKLLVKPAARVWHFEASRGGSRVHGANSPERRAAQVEDEVRFQKDFRRWRRERPDRPFMILPGPNR